MIIYITIGAITICFFKFFINIDGYTILKEYINNKYNKWKRLTNLVSTQYDSNFMITFISLKMVFQTLYQSLLQYMDNSIIKINRNTYELKYVINGKLYKMIINPLRGPVPILNVKNEYNEDITDIIIPYLGHRNDWNEYKFYPQFFNYKQLKIELNNGEIKIFNNSETIII